MATEKNAGEKQLDDVDDIKTSIRRLLLKRLFTDVEFRVEGGQFLKSIYAHKTLLACRSPVLADIFYEGPDTSFLTVSDVEASGVEQMISYIYFDEFVTSSVPDLKQTLKVATKFGIKSLQNLCVSTFADLNVNADNVFEVLEAADFIRDEGIRQKCLKLLTNDTEAALNSSAFKNASLVTVLCIFRLPELSVYSEASLLEAAIVWLKHNPNCSSKDEVLSCIGITTLSTEEFLEIVEKFPKFFSDSEIVKILLNIRHFGSRDLPTFCVTHSVKRKHLKHKIGVPHSFETTEMSETTFESKLLPAKKSTRKEVKATAVVTANKCIQTSDGTYILVPSIPEQRDQLNAEWKCSCCGCTNSENTAKETVHSPKYENEIKNQPLIFNHGHFSDLEIYVDEKEQECFGMSSTWNREEILRQLTASSLSSEHPSCQSLPPPEMQVHRRKENCPFPRNNKYKAMSDQFRSPEMINRPINQIFSSRIADDSHRSHLPTNMRQDLVSKSVLPPKTVNDTNSMPILPSSLIADSNSKPLPPSRIMKDPNRKPTVPPKPMRMQVISSLIIKENRRSKPVPPPRIMKNSSNKATALKIMKKHLISDTIPFQGK
ncbi:BTB/POZ domain-containing protein 3, partial [Stegodyphus mimosarum]